MTRRITPVTLAALLVAIGCKKPADPAPSTPAAPPLTTPSEKPPVAAKAQYPPGWQLADLEGGFARVPIDAPMGIDFALSNWFEKTFANIERGLDRAAWMPLAAYSRSSDDLKLSIVRVRLPGNGREPVSKEAIDGAFKAIARRSPDMQEADTPGAAGAGYGQGKLYEGETARLFVRIGQGKELYILLVRGGKDLSATDARLRAFFDGFAPNTSRFP